MQKYHLHNRPNREILDSDTLDSILYNGKFASIAMCRNNEPYIVSLSYGYDKTKHALYFHCASEGLKLDFLRANNHVCATIIEDGGYIKDECGHAFRSLVFWGNMDIVSQIEEQRYGMQIILQHLEEQPSIIKKKRLQSEEFYSKMTILRLDIKEMHGKAGR